MRFAVLAYESSHNFGDEIQSVAAARLMPRVDLAIARERLAEFQSDEQCILLMNGWHGAGTQFPPAECITPLYVGFHIADKAYFTRPECIAHFHKHAPIGCRDRGTMDILRAAGVDAFYSKCLTLTLPKRELPGGKGAYFVGYEEPDMRDLRQLRRAMGFQKSQMISHYHLLDSIGNDAKTAIAKGLLSLYRNAALVVTSRLHCALPCAAMGVPVLYFGPREYRTEILADIGITMHSPFTPPPKPPKRKQWEIWKSKRMKRLLGFDGGETGEADKAAAAGIPQTGETPDLADEKRKIIAAVRQKLAPHCPGGKGAGGA